VKPANLQQFFFFDLPLSDVYGVGCLALRLLYYGCEEGAFGRNCKNPVDLEGVQAFQISLKHRTVYPLSDDYEYHLVYYRKELGLNLWSGKQRKGHPKLRKLTRRVKLSLRPTLEPNRLRQFYIKSNRPVHVAQYGSKVPTDHSVPDEYIEKFGELFEGFLVRTKKGYSLGESLFEAQGLAFDERRDVLYASETAPHVLIFSEQKESESVQMRA